MGAVVLPGAGVCGFLNYLLGHVSRRERPLTTLLVLANHETPIIKKAKGFKLMFSIDLKSISIFFYRLLTYRRTNSTPHDGTTHNIKGSPNGLGWKGPSFLNSLRLSAAIG